MLATTFPLGLLSQLCDILGPQNLDQGDVWCWRGCASGEYSAHLAYSHGLSIRGLQPSDASFMMIWHFKVLEKLKLLFGCLL